MHGPRLSRAGHRLPLPKALCPLHGCSLLLERVLQSFVLCWERGPTPALVSSASLGPVHQQGPVLLRTAVVLCPWTLNKQLP